MFTGGVDKQHRAAMGKNYDFFSLEKMDGAFL